MAASSSGKKKPAAKESAAAKKNTKKAPQKSSQLTLSDIIDRRELYSTVIFVIGILLLIVMLFAGTVGSLWNRVHTFYLAVFGITGYYLPLAVLFSGVVKVMNKNKPVYGFKIAELFFLLVIISGLIHINVFSKTFPELSYAESIKAVYHSVMDHTTSAASNGGLIGALFGGALFRLGRSRVIANIISVFFLLADMMVLFGITLFRLFSEIEKPARKVGVYTGEAIGYARSDLEKRKKEYAAERERKKADVRPDPTRAAADFYKNNPQTGNDAVSLPGRQTKASKTVKENAAPVFSGDIPSIFDMAEKKAESIDEPPRNNVQPVGNIFASVYESRKADIGIAFDEPQIADPGPSSGKVVQLDASASQDKAVKADPLTSEEKASFETELKEGLENVPVIEYKKPPIACLNPPKPGMKNYDPAELKSNGERLIAALNSFNVQASIVDVVPGPTVTRYELSPAPGVKISKFVGLSDDLALHMAAPAGLRIEAPIPNKAAIGIEIPNKNKVTVTFREIIDNEKFLNSKSKLNVALGKDIAGDIIFSDIAKMPHLLVAGTTGSGKSVCLNTMIMSILYNATPDEVKIILIDPKQVEFGVYNGLPHLLVPVVSDPRKASGALGWAVTEMLSRYKTLNANGVRDIVAYNSLCEERDDLVKMPQIVIFIDELSDLMTVAPAEVEDSIQRLAQMARAAGMHLVVATQRPSVDVITGVIKANIPSRIALTVKSQIDSRTIIDSAGAEKLMGYGDMLYYPVGVPKPIRVQGAYLSDKEIENVVEFIKSNQTATYDDSVQQEIERQAAAEKKKGAAGADASESSALDKNDDLLMRAIELFVSAPEKASISALQRHLSLGFAKAGRLMDTLEEKGIVGPTEGSKPRKVLITKAQWYEMSAMSSDVAGAPTAQSDADNAFDNDGFEEVPIAETYQRTLDDD